MQKESVVPGRARGRVGGWRVLAIACLLAGPQFAQTRWTGAVSSVWDVPGNWTLGVPTSGTDAFIDPGLPNDPSTSGVAGAECLSLTIEVGGTLEIATGFPLEVNADATLLGPITTPGAGPNVLRFLGTGTVASAGFSLPFVEVSGSVTATSDLTFAGWVEVDPGGTLDLGGGDHIFEGDLMVNGTIASAGLVSLDPPPATSLDLSIVTGSLTDVAILGAITTSTSIDIDGDVSLGGVTSSWDLGIFVHDVGGDWTSSGGSATGPGAIRFDGSGALQTGTGSISNVLIAAGSRLVQSSTIAGNLAMTGGDLTVADAQTLAVAGDVDFTGGELAFDDTPGGTELVDIEGSAHFACTAGTHTAASLVECAGNWTGNSTYDPGEGTVRLDGGGTTIGGAGGDATPTFNRLELTGGTVVPSSSFTLDPAILTIAATSSFDVGAFTVSIPAATAAVAGELRVGAGGDLRLGAATTVLVGGGSATLRVVGSSVAPARVSGFAGGGYQIDVQGGVFEARRFVFADMGDSGVKLRAAASLGAKPNDLREGRFEGPSPLPNSAMVEIERPVATNFHDVDFVDGPPSVGTHNVRVLAGAALCFVNSEGNFSGPFFEDDPFGQLCWVEHHATGFAGQFELGTGGGGRSPRRPAVGEPGGHDDIQAALAAALESASPVVHVAPGVYPPFTVRGGGWSGTLRILGTGPGAARIDTRSGPVEIVGLGPTEHVELGALEIGAPPDGHGLVVRGNDGVVAVDRATVRGSAGTPGVLVEGSRHVALQRSELTGDPGLSVRNGSHVVVHAGSADETVVEEGSSVRDGAVPGLDAPSHAPIGGLVPVVVAGERGSLVTLFAASALHWVELPGVEGVGLVDPSARIVGGATLGASPLPVSVRVPADPGTVGVPLVLQALHVRPVPAAPRWSNAVTVVLTGGGPSGHAQCPSLAGEPPAASR